MQLRPTSCLTCMICMVARIYIRYLHRFTFKMILNHNPLMTGTGCSSHPDPPGAYSNSSVGVRREQTCAFPLYTNTHIENEYITGYKFYFWNMLYVSSHGFDLTHNCSVMD